MAYADLTAPEQAHFDEYRNLHAISDWPGFTASQRARMDECHAWIVARRKELRRLIAHDAKNNGRLRRRKRLATLKDGNLKRGGATRGAQLPAMYGTAREKVLIEEREVYWLLKPSTEQQRRRKAANLAELAELRRKLWAVMESDPKNNDRLHRERRRDNLCIATRTGSAWKTWKANHNPQTGKAKPTQPQRRQAIIAFHKAHEGISEIPANSNTDNREDGIRRAQIDCAGGSSGLISTPWCGEWAWQGCHRAGVEDIGTWWMASVSSIEDHARAGLGPYRGWVNGFTTAAHQGDQAVIGGRGVHVATIEEVTPTGYWTREGNTSPGTAGSQSNGGWAGKRFRPAASIHGVARLELAA